MDGMEANRDGRPMPEKLPRTAQECETLGQWRELVLGQSQRAIAENARVKQARISEIELGHLPRRRYWSGLIAAYAIQGEDREEQFYRMIMNAKRIRAIQHPIEEDSLFGQARADGPGQVIDLDVSANLHAPAGKSVRGA